jgi:hypothetical protein
MNIFEYFLKVYFAILFLKVYFAILFLKVYFAILFLKVYFFKSIIYVRRKNKKWNFL